jgi:hypothetical protein
LHGNVASVVAVMGAASVGEGVATGPDVHIGVGVGEDDADDGAELEADALEVAAAEATSTAEGVGCGDADADGPGAGPAGCVASANPVATRTTIRSIPPMLASRALCGRARQRATDLDDQPAAAVRNRVITSSPLNSLSSSSY